MRAQQHGTAAAGRWRDRTQPEERRGYARHIRGPGRFKARDDSYQVRSTRTIDTKTGQRKYPLACEFMVGVRRFELLTSSVSGSRRLAAPGPPAHVLYLVHVDHSSLALPTSQTEATTLPGRPRVVDAPMLAPESFSCSDPKSFGAQTRNCEAVKHTSGHALPVVGRNPEWWWNVLIDEGDLLYRELEAI